MVGEQVACMRDVFTHGGTGVFGVAFQDRIEKLPVIIHGGLRPSRYFGVEMIGHVPGEQMQHPRDLRSSGGEVYLPVEGVVLLLERLSRYGDKVAVVAQDEAGALDLGSILGTPTPGTAVYCCGPEGLLNAVEERCAPWPSGALHLERFTAREQTGENSAFSIVLERSGLTLDVPADKSIYEVCKENDIPVLGSCLEGICGTCETDVLDGEVEHRDVVLDEAERQSNTTMMICVSRCLGRQLTLDI